MLPPVLGPYRVIVIDLTWPWSGVDLYSWQKTSGSAELLDHIYDRELEERTSSFLSLLLTIDLPQVLRTR